MSEPAATPENTSLPSRLAPLLPVVLAYRARWALALFVLLAAAAATLAVPQAFHLLIDTSLTSAAVGTRFLQLVGVAVLLALFTTMRFCLMAWLGERVVADIRECVFSAVLTQPPVFFETLRVSEVLSRLSADTTLVQTLAGTSVSMVLRSGVVLPMWAMGRHLRRRSRHPAVRVSTSRKLGPWIAGVFWANYALGGPRCAKASSVRVRLSTR